MFGSLRFPLAKYYSIPTVAKFPGHTSGITVRVVRIVHHPWLRSKHSGRKLLRWKKARAQIGCQEVEEHEFG